MRTNLAIAIVAIGVVLGASPLLQAQFGFRARDPGPRRDSQPGAGGPIVGLTGNEPEMFTEGQTEFLAEEEVDEGVGPRFNFVSCAGCHAQPAVGGTSPAANPLFRLTRDFGFSADANRFPSFLDPDGPVREVRFKRKPDNTPDGGVHALFVITGHKDPTTHEESAPDCHISQENFEQQFQNGNLTFRIPTPVFGAGLIEQILDSTILANLTASPSQKSALGIRGKINKINVSGSANRNGNDGTVTRFGWKAQNKSLLLFSGEAYNVEMGITNELFQNERDETPGCQIANVPNDVTSGDANPAILAFANFQRFLAPPTPATPPGVTAESVSRGRQQFTTVGCVYCHTPTLRTNPKANVEALRGQDANLYSDLAVHAMGPGLADDVSQGLADGNEFRTAPLWGLGKRIFFLHDGRTTDLLQAIQAHKSFGNSKYPASEANAVVDRFNNLREQDKQDLANFLRSL